MAFAGGCAAEAPEDAPVEGDAAFSFGGFGGGWLVPGMYDLRSESGAGGMLLIERSGFMEYNVSVNTVRGVNPTFLFPLVPVTVNGNVATATDLTDKTCKIEIRRVAQGQYAVELPAPCKRSAWGGKDGNGVFWSRDHAQLLGTYRNSAAQLEITKSTAEGLTFDLRGPTGRVVSGTAAYTATSLFGMYWVDDKCEVTLVNPTAPFKDITVHTADACRDLGFAAHYQLSR